MIEMHPSTVFPVSATFEDAFILPSKQMHPALPQHMAHIPSVKIVVGGEVQRRGFASE